MKHAFTYIESNISAEEYRLCTEKNIVTRRQSNTLKWLATNMTRYESDLYIRVTSSAVSRQDGARGGPCSPPGVSKVSLLLFISVICITYVKKTQAPHQNKPPKKLFFCLKFFKIYNFFFNFSNLHEKSGISRIKRKTKFQIFIFRVMVLFSPFLFWK